MKQNVPLYSYYETYAAIMKLVFFALFIDFYADPL